MNLLIFSLQDKLFGVDISFVERVILAVDYSHLSDVTSETLGAINYHGELIPLISLRRLLNFEDKEIDLNDNYLICQFDNKKIAFWVDQIKQVITHENEVQVLKSDSIQTKRWLGTFIENNQEVIPILDVKKLCEQLQVQHK